MPSQQHETLVELFKQGPQLAVELLRRVFQLEIPEYDLLKPDDASFSDVKPASYHADGLILVQAKGESQLAVVVEVQLERDPHKHMSWPVYGWALRARHGCPAVVLVLCTDQSVARWCAKPIELGAGNIFRPLVVGPEAIPPIVDAQVVKACPELGVLSAIAHGSSEDAEKAVEVALCAVGALSELPAGRDQLYYDMILAALGEAARKAFEMEAKQYEYQSDFAKKYVKQGIDAGKRQLVETLLRKNFGDLPSEVLERLAVAGEDELTLWAERVLSASSLDEVFK